MNDFVSGVVLFYPHMIDGNIDNDHKEALDFLYKIKDDYIS